MDNICSENLAKALFREIDKSLQFDGANLQGTLCLPVEGSATQLVLILPGNGEVDRNGNSMQIQLNLFNAIAHDLAAAGIASFRFDKRGCSMSEGNFHETGFLNFVDDAEAWLNSIASFLEVENPKIYLLGHSEGTLISALISSSNPLVKGQVLLAPFMENMEHTIERQLSRTLDEIAKLTGLKGVLVRFFIRMSGNQLSKQRKLMKRVKNTTKSTIKLKKTLINAKWLREIVAIEPPDIYKNNSVPTLSIGGEKDLQHPAADAEAVSMHVKGPVEVHVLSNLTHILRVDEGEPSTFKYKQLVDAPLDSRVTELVIKFVLANS